MSRGRTRRTLAVVAALALLATACGDGDDADDGAGDDNGSATEIPDGPPIDVSSFNFPESEILGEIYAQALEDAGYDVERTLSLGARELIYPELIDGEISLVPEYLGSALVVWFEQDPPEDLDSGVSALREAFEPEGVSVLEPAPAENNQAFVVTSSFAEENGLSSISDLADAGEVTFAGPPECEGRDTCYQGLVDRYGLDDVTFESVQEAAARLAALDSGEVEMILLFSTDAPLAGEELVVLEDTEGMLPPENITPVVRTEVLDAYGDDLEELLDRVTAALSTDALQQMNAEASEGRSPAEIATDWLADNL
jgi:osmoprotectant transport system substrate-binding protein